MALSVIILAGARNSGKTKTLDEMARRLQKTSARTYSFKGKVIRIYKSSPQEQCTFCHYQKVITIIDGEIRRCVSENCTLLIVPFTMGMNRQGELNADCITKPTDHLRSGGLKVHLVYFRRESVRRLNLLDDLMSRLGAQIIKSTQDYTRQAHELLAIARADP